MRKFVHAVAGCLLVASLAQAQFVSATNYTDSNLDEAFDNAVDAGVDAVGIPVNGSFTGAPVEGTSTVSGSAPGEVSFTLSFADSDVVGVELSFDEFVDLSVIPAGTTELEVFVQLAFKELTFVQSVPTVSLASPVGQTVFMNFFDSEDEEVLPADLQSTPVAGANTIFSIPVSAIDPSIDPLTIMLEVLPGQVEVNPFGGVGGGANISVEAVPEAGSLALAGFAALGVTRIVVRRRRRS